MTDVVVDRLRIRGAGAHGRRLAGIAARLLPDALERACADLPDAALGPLTVTLDLDPADYDDQTLATLWASRIRVAAIGALPAGRGAAGSTVPAGPVGGAAGADRGAPRSGATGALQQLELVVRQWLASGEVPPNAWLRVLAAPAAAAGVVAGLRQPEVAALLALLAGRRVGDAGTASPSVEGERVGAAGAGGRSATVPTGSAPRATSPTGVAPGAAAPRRSAAPDEVPAAARRLAAAAAALLADPEPTGAGAPARGAAGSVTTVAGLVLLYPWLAEHCDRACARHPMLEPVAVRRAALARLADPEQPWLVDDPIVLLLAGATGPPGRLAPLADLGEVDESAAGVLSSFAALLPGFARSTPGYVRAEWVARLGVLDTDGDPVRLTAERRELDLVLPRLPYPLGLLRLPWSPVVSVRFAP